LKGKSVNTSAFLLAALSHLWLVRPLPEKKRQHELLDPKPFLDLFDRLTTSSETPKRPTKKATVKKASTKKAAIKKRASARRKQATATTKKQPRPSV
jgi:hypothetical protein